MTLPTLSDTANRLTDATHFGGSSGGGATPLGVLLSDGSVALTSDWNAGTSAVTFGGKATITNLIGASVVNNGNSGASKTINWTTGNRQKITTTASCTLTFTSPGGPASLFLEIIHEATTTPYTYTWPVSVTWNSGAAPTTPNTSGGTMVVEFFFDGTTYFGSYSLPSTIVSSQWTTSSSDIYFAGGQVGIGSAPTGMDLDVLGATGNVARFAATAGTGGVVLDGANGSILRFFDAASQAWAIGGTTASLTFYDGTGSAIGTMDATGLFLGAGAVEAALIQAPTGAGVTLLPDTGQIVELSGGLKYSGATYAASLPGIASSGASNTVHWTTANRQSIITDASCTLSFVDPPGPTSLTLEIIHDGTTATYVYTWPANVKWSGGTKPTTTNTAYARDIVSFFFDGSNYYGAASLDMR